MARMKIIGHRLRPAHTDVGGQLGVAALMPGFLWSAGGAVEMDNLAQCVDTRIGAPRTVNPHRMIRNVRQRGLQRVLHRGHQGFALRLPTVIRGAVILDAQRNAPWRFLADQLHSSYGLAVQGCSGTATSTACQTAQQFAGFLDLLV